jgi:dTDP-4-dehydrorhamnose reductase
METEVHPISTDEYPTKAKRPRNSRLSRRSLEEAEFELPEPWQDAVRKYIHGDLGL